MPQFRKVDGLGVDRADAAVDETEEFQGQTSLFRASKNVATRSIDEQIIESRLHAGQFLGNVVPSVDCFAQLPRLDASYQLLNAIDHIVQVRVRTDIELSKSLKELRQVRQGRIAEDLGPPVGCPRQPFGQMRHKLRQFTGKGLFGESDRLIKAGGDACLLLLKESGLSSRR